tara:strand:- start:205 stop:363 length:159 start_codon:yes stop_codon:yes gene_type:complete
VLIDLRARMHCISHHLQDRAYLVRYEIDGVEQWHRLHGNGKIVEKWRPAPVL